MTQVAMSPLEKNEASGEASNENFLNLLLSQAIESVGDLNLSDGEVTNLSEGVKRIKSNDEDFKVTIGKIPSQISLEDVVSGVNYDIHRLVGALDQEIYIVPEITVDQFREAIIRAQGDYIAAKKETRGSIQSSKEGKGPTDIDWIS